MKDGAKFCTHCGAAIGGKPTAEKLPEKKKGSGTLLTALIVILAVLIVGVSGAAFWFLGGKDIIYDAVGIDADPYDDVEDEEDEEEEEEEDKREKEEDGEEPIEDAELPPAEDSEGTFDDAMPEEAEMPAAEEITESEYILENSDIEYLTKSDLAGFTAEQCRLARNELYARHGRLFDDEALQNYFEQRSWYRGRIAGEDFQESMLSEVEMANRDLIVEYEKEMGYR